MVVYQRELAEKDEIKLMVKLSVFAYRAICFNAMFFAIDFVSLNFYFKLLIQNFTHIYK